MTNGLTTQEALNKLEARFDSNKETVFDRLRHLEKEQKHFEISAAVNEAKDEARERLVEKIEEGFVRQVQDLKDSHHHAMQESNKHNSERIKRLWTTIGGLCTALVPLLIFLAMELLDITKMLG